MANTPEPQEHRAARFDRGMAEITEVDGDGGQRIINALADISPELAHQIISWAYGDIYSRPGLVPRDRQLITIGVLSALGGCEAELDVHLNAALNVGLTPDEIIEALLHTAVYAGIPRSLNATLVAKKVFSERGVAPTPSDIATD